MGHRRQDVSKFAFWLIRKKLVPNYGIRIIPNVFVRLSSNLVNHVVVCQFDKMHTAKWKFRLEIAYAAPNLLESLLIAVVFAIYTASQPPELVDERRQIARFKTILNVMEV